MSLTRFNQPGPLVMALKNLINDDAKKRKCLTCGGDLELTLETLSEKYDRWRLALVCVVCHRQTRAIIVNWKDLTGIWRHASIDNDCSHYYPGMN